MFPELFRIGNFPVTSFGVMLVVSFIAGAYALSRQLARYGMQPQLAWDLLIYIMVGGIVGAKLYYHLLHPADFLADPIGELFSRGGLVWYGGFIGGVLGYYFAIRKRKLPAAVMFDASGPALALAYALGRVGCFLVGDDYGLPTDSWVGVVFPEGASPPSTAGYLRSVGADVPASIPDSQLIPVHPTQLYETGLALIMFAILWIRGGKPHRQGQLFGLFTLMYAVERFLIEFVRAKGDRIVLGLSTSQLASIVLLGISLWLLFGRGSAPAAPLGDASASRVRQKPSKVRSSG
jgi:phosphatidylglycerol:prolipoprotein diacylglycerol transferase